MRKSFATLLILLSYCAAIFAQESIYSIITNPGADCTKQMRVSWATDSCVTGSYLMLTEEADANWAKAKKFVPEQEFLCRDYYGVPSKAPNNDDIVETPVFNKCGVTLNRLKKSTKYKYRIMSPSGEQSDVHHFATAGKKEWKACIISDFHSYTPLPNRLKCATGMIDTLSSHAGSIDWVLCLGDVTAWGGSYSFWKELYTKPVFSNYLWAGLIGNHDNMTRKSVFTHNFFLNTSYYPTNGYEQERGVVYHFTYGDALFIMLNSESMPNNEGLERAQNWVRKVIAEHRDAKYIIVCQHWEWFLGHDSRGQGKSSQYHRWRQLFDECGVDLALAGNNHVYMRTDALYNGQDVPDFSRGTVYLQTAASDNERGRKPTSELLFNSDKIKRMWSEGPHTVSAVLLEAHDKFLSLTLLDRMGNEIDKVRVRAKR